MQVRQASFEQWWEPFTLSVGPAGAYLASLAPDRRAVLREPWEDEIAAAITEFRSQAQPGS